MDAEDGQRADDMQADAQADGRLVGAFLAGGWQPAASCRGRLAAWLPEAWLQVVWLQVVWLQVVWLRVVWLRELPDARPPHHFQVELEADWQSVARDVCWATATRLA